MAQRSLHVVTNVYYKSMSCFGTVFPTGLACSAKVFPHMPLVHYVGWANHHANSYSFEQDT
jgi:hypothetical protein